MKKELRCPICNTRIIDSGMNTVSELIPVISEDGQLMDYYIKCKGCKRQIGLNKK